ncbi:MAG: 50S ribosomal protein L21 [Bdellovibrionota bacterium]
MSQSKFAIVNIFGRQFKVAEGDKINASFVESAVAGTKFTFPEVLMLNNGDNLKVGAPLVTGAKVTAEFVQHGREDKIIVFKYLRKNKSKKMRGHRQPFTTLSITGIEG